MKRGKLGTRVCAVILLLVLLSMPALAAGKSFYVNANGVSLRSGPAKSYGLKRTMKRGTVVTVYDSKNGWSYVRYRKNANTTGTGWIYRKYLTSISPTKISTGRYTTIVNLRVRSSAEVKGNNVIGKLKRGSRVIVKKQLRSWAYVQFKGGFGWVGAKYLKKA